MRKFSYLLFPKLLIGLGILFILLFIYQLVGIVYATLIEKIPAEDLTIVAGRSMGVLFIGLIMISARTTIVFNPSERMILKRTTILWMNMSTEKITVPESCTELMAKGKVKHGKGYLNLVVPLSYEIKAYDLYLKYGGGFKKLISTDYTNARHIAELLKESMNISCQIK